MDTFEEEEEEEEEELVDMKINHKEIDQLEAELLEVRKEMTGYLKN